jgi:hypothetical protein
MANSTEREPGRSRLAMDNGEVVEVDGSTLVDEDTGRTVTAVVPTSVPSGRRASVAAVLRDREAFEVGTLIAVVDAAAWWLDQPHGDNYCTSLLNA